MYCTECGAVLDEQGVCPNPSCANHKPQADAISEIRTMIKDAVRLPIKSPEKGKQIVPDCISADQDEVPIKQYDIARLQSLIKVSRAEGRLQVTNKRILFRATGSSLFGPTLLQHEFSIEEIAGVELRKESRFNFLPTLLLILFSAAIILFVQPFFAPIYKKEALGVIFALLLTIAAIFLFFLLRKRTYLRYIIMSMIVGALPLGTFDLLETALGSGSSIITTAYTVMLLAYCGSLFCLAFAPNLVVRVITKGGSPSVEIRRKDSIFSFQHNEYTGVSQVMPGPEAELAMKELGAVIREVQQTGKYSSQ